MDSVFKDRTLMITGGTGSFGHTVLKHFLTTDIGEIRIFSRDEKNRMICAMSFRHSIRNRRGKSNSMWEMCGISALWKMPCLGWIIFSMRQP